MAQNDGVAAIRSRPEPWQVELAGGYSQLDELLASLGLAAEDCGISTEAARRFPLRVPRSFVARMRRGDPRDPLLLQVLPTVAETLAVPGYGSDPVGDLASVLSPGLLQKYAGRALLISTGACAVHCRYCFRREFPYAELGLRAGAEADALAAVATDPGITELIVSGGDPLVLGNRRLRRLVTAAGRIGHVRRLRLHTRTPIVLPSRVDDGLLDLIRRSALPVVVVVHVNHPREIDPDTARALRSLAANSHQLLNQSVLLRGVNDNADTLAELSEALFGVGVMPYYLHQLDAVAGAAHFDVPASEARELLAQLRARLPGYLVPKLVREIAGAAAKMPVDT
jgi:EF-P beta-lysylation protein EpmB